MFVGVLLAAVGRARVANSPVLRAHKDLAAAPAAKPSAKRSFAVLEDHDLIHNLDIVGPRAQRKKIPQERQLVRQLNAARERHKKFSALVEELDNPKSAGWRGADLKRHKREKLLARDKINQLVSALRRLREGHSWQLGSGAAGRVLLGRQYNLEASSFAPSSDEQLVAIKVVPIQQQQQQQQLLPHDDDASAPGEQLLSSLSTEIRVLAELTARGEVGFPRLLYSGRQDVLIDGERVPSSVLVMTLLGPSVEELLWATSVGTKLSTACVLRLGVQMLERLQRLHTCGYVHNDCKPSNFCLGLPRGAQASDQDVVHMVDFGCCTPIEQQPQTPTRPPLVDGTPLFASRAAHLGERWTRPEDDLESLCFCLAYLSGTTLPWAKQLSTGTVAGEENAVPALSRAASARQASVDLAAAKEEYLRHWSQLDAAGEDDGTAVPEVVLALWREVWRAADSADRGHPVEYVYDGEWPAACRRALELGCGSRSPKNAADDEDCGGKGDLSAADGDAECSVYDWDAAGITWSREGEILPGPEPRS